MCYALHNVTAGDTVYVSNMFVSYLIYICVTSRCCLLQVWDMNNLTKSSHVIQTITPVAQIRWRPQRKYHIASCSLLLDFSVNVWDIRRPFVPFAAFTEHKDCVTGSYLSSQQLVILMVLWCSLTPLLFLITLEFSDMPRVDRFAD